MTESLRIHLLGGFRLGVGSRHAHEAVWRLRKARTLIKLLALAPGHCLHREEVMETLWPDLEPQAATNNLHQTLHVARRAVAGAGAASDYLRLRDDQLRLAPAHLVWVDVDEFEAAAADARRLRTLGAYAAALAGYTGELLPEDRYENWALARRDDLAGLYNALLTEMAQAQAAVGAHDAAIVTLRQLLRRDATNEVAHVKLMHLLGSAGRGHEAVRQYHQLREALRDELDVEPALETERAYQSILNRREDPTAVQNSRAAETAPDLEQRIAFCEVDGARIAYATLGHGPPLVFDSGWVSHLEYTWQAGPYRRFLAALAQEHTLVRWDRRGTGLSDRHRPDASVEADVRAMEAVISALGFERVDVFAACNATHVGALYAMRHPGRVGRLILYGTWAAGAALASPEVRASLLGLIRAHWGLGSRTLADMFVADEDADTLAWFAQAQRLSASPDMAANLLEGIYANDLRPLLPTLRVPTLVLHRRDDRAVPFRHGCEVAVLIPGASLRPLEGTAHLAYCGDANSVLDAAHAFLVTPVGR